MAAPHLTPTDVQRAGLMAMQVLQGRTFWVFRINPSTMALKRAVDGLLSTVRHIDPERYSAEDFASVIGVLDDAAETMNGFYRLYRHSGDIDFLYPAVNEISSAKRAIMQGLAPNRDLWPNEAQKQRRIQESTMALYEAIMSETDRTSSAAR